MDQKKNLPSVIEDRGDDLVREYVAQLENNIEYFKEQCAILQTQKELAQGKIRRLEWQLFQCMQTSDKLTKYTS